MFKVANIPQVYGDKLEHMERRAFHALQLFTHWRSEEDITAGFKNAIEAFKYRCVKGELDKYQEYERLRVSH